MVEVKLLGAGKSVGGEARARTQDVRSQDRAAGTWPIWKLLHWSVKWKRRGFLEVSAKP